MYCPECGYAKSPFEEECSRCRRMATERVPETTEADGREIRGGRLQFVWPLKLGRPPSSVVPWALGLLALLVLCIPIYCVSVRPDASTPARIPSFMSSPSLPEKYTPSPETEAPSPFNGLAPSSPTPSPTDPGPDGVLFTELPGQTETPTIEMTNQSDQTVYFTFRGPVDVDLLISPGFMRQFNLPSGDYTFTIRGDTIPQRRGRAIFRRQKLYQATWVVVNTDPWATPEPLTMGDLP